jgi:hypothetical protein
MATTTRKTATKKMAAPTAWPFSVQAVKLSDMFIDFGYQRETRGQFVVTNASDDTFRPDLVHVLTLSKRADGRYAIVDGGHRYLMLMERGIAEWTAVVYENLSYDDEADLFVELNFRRNSVRPYERHRAMIEAKVPMALALRACAEDEGFVIAASANGENAIGAISSLEEVFLVAKHEAGTTFQRHVEVRKWITTSETEGPDLLRKTLASLREAWSDRDSWAQGKAGNMIRGVARFLAKHPNVTVEEMALVLRHSDPLSVQQEARHLQKPGAGSGKGRPVETVVERLYKKHGDARLLKKSAKENT